MICRRPCSISSKSLVQWALRKGRAAIFADCGLGKTPMQLAWADQIARRTNKRILILTPLAVRRQQTVAEGEKSRHRMRAVGRWQAARAYHRRQLRATAPVRPE